MKYLIFTDLDGSLLDHFDYSFDPAKPALEALSRHRIPVICSTSKTYEELTVLREELDNRDPFIVENGAAVYIPKDYFSLSFQAGHAEHIEAGDYNCYSFVQSRRYWQKLIAEQGQRYSGQYSTFEELGVEGIVEHTGLSHDAARRANMREFGEPVLWTGDEMERKAFIKSMTLSGATVLQGGRFMHVSGSCDKGAALKWLVAAFEYEEGDRIVSIAAGDSSNDIAMLEAADKSIIIRSPVHRAPEINRIEDVLLTDSTGPSGWVEGINRFLSLE